MRGNSGGVGGGRLGGGGGGLSQSMHSNMSSSSTFTGTISTINTMEQPHFSKYNRFFPNRGYFCCKGCGNPLYSVTSKFNNFDGYPAFGECIDGSLELISWEEQQKQELIKEQQRIEEIERKERNRQNMAAITIQSLMRGAITRMKLAKTLDELINDLQERKNRKKREEDHFGADPLLIEDDDDDEPWDMTLSRHSEVIDRMFFMGHDSTNTFNTKNSYGKKSCISGISSTSGGSFFDDDDDDDFSCDDDDDDISFASFGDDYDDDDNDNNNDKKESNSNNKKMKRHQHHHQKHHHHQQQQRSNISNNNNNNQKQEEIRNWLQEEKEEGRNEIHCHRCKSHIGSVKEKQCKGRKPNQLFKEHHRVNGRAIKYIEDDLPKRTNYQTTLLFANQSQARLMGGGGGGSSLLRTSTSMHGDKEEKIPEFLLKSRAAKLPGSVPFVSPRTQRKKGVLSQSSHNNNNNNNKEVVQKRAAFPKNSALEKLLLSRTMH